MGKIRRQRRKLHITSSENVKKNEPQEIVHTAEYLPVLAADDNIFSGVNIDFDSVKTNIQDDMRSIKSFKSAKNIQLSKKEKLLLRKKMLLKKIDTVKQMKKEEIARQKRKNISIIGDTNPLRDALPSLESLLKDRRIVQCNFPPHGRKQKGIEKINKRKKQQIEHLQTFKNIIKNINVLNAYRVNPFDVISKHVKNVVEQEKCQART